MTMQLARELEGLKRSILEQCALVETGVRTATAAFLGQDVEAAERVIENDRLVDGAEVEIEEECLKILALHQPVAANLRFVVTVVKINNFLERIGDLAENLSRKTRSLAKRLPISIPAEFSEMSGLAVDMLKNSIDAFINHDSAGAGRVIASDDEVDSHKRMVRRVAEAAVMETPSSFPQWLTVIAASRNLERIGDLAANIAEEVVYLTEGRIVRRCLEPE